MKPLIPTLAAGAFALVAAVAFAQAPGGGPGYGPGAGPMGGGRGITDCSKAQDPAQCEQRRTEMQKRRGEMRDQMRSAYEACKDKDDRRACMTEQICSKAQDPAQCQSRAKERHARMGQRMDERQQMHEACTGKRGEELGKCLREQHDKHRQSRPGGKT